MVCRQLGFVRATQYGNSYGAGTGIIWLDNVHCRGTEHSLASCSHLGWGNHNCGHSEDVGVTCLDGMLSSHFLTFLTF